MHLALAQDLLSNNKFVGRASTGIISVSVYFISRALLLGILQCTDSFLLSWFELRNNVRTTVTDLAELPVLVLPRSTFDGADARLGGHVQFRAQTAVNT